MAHCDTHTPAPTFRLPVKGLTAAALLVVFLLLTLVMPRTELDPDMAWRGNSASLEMIR